MIGVLLFTVIVAVGVYTLSFVVIILCGVDMIFRVVKVRVRVK